MSLQAGHKLPKGALLRKTAGGMETVDPAAMTGRVALFALPGAYTGTCTNAHMPSFVRTADQFRAKGVDRIVCVTVNDPHVTEAWEKSTGADAAGIEVLADADGAWTQAAGMAFDAPPAGLYGRSKRYAALIDNGTVKVLHVEDNPGACAISAGEALLKEV